VISTRTPRAPGTSTGQGCLVVAGTSFASLHHPIYAPRRMLIMNSVACSGMPLHGPGSKVVWRVAAPSSPWSLPHGLARVHEAHAAGWPLPLPRNTPACARCCWCAVSACTDLCSAAACRHRFRRGRAIKAAQAGPFRAVIDQVLSRLGTPLSPDGAAQPVWRPRARLRCRSSALHPAETDRARSRRAASPLCWMARRGWRRRRRA